MDPGFWGGHNSDVMLWELRRLEGRGGDFFHACHVEMVFTNMDEF